MLHAIEVLKKTLWLTNDDFDKKRIYLFLFHSYMEVGGLKLMIYYSDKAKELKVQEKSPRLNM